MERREALKGVAVLLGGAISAPTLAGVFGGCRVGESRYVPRTLAPEQYELVADVAEIIIPQTDTPGARSARVHEYIDRMLTDWYPEEEANRFVTGLSDVDATCEELYSRAFADCTPEERVGAVRVLDENAFAARQEGTVPLPFFGFMKELTLVGYYTSEEGMTQELGWTAVPGEFRGCIPVEEALGGRS